jgi:hypothetical protein
VYDTVKSPTKIKVLSPKGSQINISSAMSFGLPPLASLSLKSKAVKKDISQNPSDIS